MRRALAPGIALVATLACSPAGAQGPGSEEPWTKGPALSSEPQAMLLAARAHPPQEGKGILDLLEETRITLDDQGRQTVTVRSVYRYDEVSALRNWNEVSANWSPWHQERPRIRARVITPDGQVHVLDPATIGEYSVGQSGGGLFESRKRLAGPLPKVAVGAIVELEISYRDTEAFFAAGALGWHSLWQIMPVLRTRLVLDLPASLPLRWKVEGLPGVTPVKVAKDGRVSLTLDLGPMEPPKEREPNSDPLQDLRPAFSYSTCANWGAVARAYEVAVKEATGVSELGAWVEAAVGTAKEPKVVIERILARLQREVRYTGIEFGSAAIIPRPPAETLRRGFGDCKDKACLLVALLGTAGIPARMALLESGYGRDAQEDLPGLNAFDHAIVVVPGTEPLWIDPTDEFARAGQLPFQDQGRMALIIDPATVSLVRTPELEAAGNLIRETRTVHLGDKGPARVVETAEYSGPAEMGLRANLVGDKPKELRDHLEQYVQKAYKAKCLGELTVGDLRDLTAPLRLVLEAKEAGIGQSYWKDAKVELNLWPMLDKLRKVVGEDEEGKPVTPRVHDLLFFEPYAMEWQYQVPAPMGYVLRELPKDDVVPLGPASLARRYQRRADGSTLATFRVESGKRRWTPAEVNEARKAITALAATNRTDFFFDQEGEALLPRAE